MNKAEYKDIIAFHPGYYLVEILEDLEMNQEEFAKRLGTSAKTVSKLLNGLTPLTDELALKVSIMFGISPETLLNLQKTFDLKVLEIEKSRKLDEQIEIAKMIDYNYFSSRKILPKTSNIIEKISNLCSFLKVSDLTLLKKADIFASYRTTVQNVQDKNIINANVWLQTALNFGYDMKVQTFDAKKLKSAIPEIRAMTRQKPDIFLPRLKEIFKECGVAFILLPALKNCGVNGVVKWYDEKVVLAINDRNVFADTFWFSLFHEIKHIFQKKIKKVIINSPELSTLDKILEDEADEYAQSELIPSKEYSSFIDSLSYYPSRNEIVSFADRINIHPGIVVGRLQHDKKLKYYMHNDLKERYKISLS